MFFPRYQFLTDEQKALVNNGCGPAWMPKFLRTMLFTWMFHAQCGHHDWGYLIGGDEIRRWECDLKFGKAMATDVANHWFRALIGTIIAPVFFILVVLFGWAFFYYGAPRSVEEALAAAKKQ